MYATDLAFLEDEEGTLQLLLLILDFWFDGCRGFNISIRIQSFF